MRIGIVGHGEDKFTLETQVKAKQLIYTLLKKGDTVVSGHSPVGGVDIWAEEIGRELECKLDIKSPQTHSWGGKYGYKERNLDIAGSSDIVHVIVVKEYPPNYKGMRFDSCYHCHMRDHVKSGGCWTAKQAYQMGKPVKWHII